MENTLGNELVVVKDTERSLEEIYHRDNEIEDFV
jgi:hypothetical protein